MHKRKIGGLIPYGHRTYDKKPSQKLQTGGGFAVYSGHYNWREDPYEIRLLENKMREDRANIYGDAISGTGTKGKQASGAAKPGKLGSFEPITGGLKGMRDEANAQAQQMIDLYQTQVDRGGWAWVNSKEGQVAYQAVVRDISKLQDEVDDAKDRFDEYKADRKSKGGTNDNVLAISTDGRMMAQDAEGNSSVITVGDWLTDPSKYKYIYKVTDVEKIVESGGFSVRPYIDEFLGPKVAVSPETAYDVYIKDREHLVDYQVIKGHLARKGASADEIDSMSVDEVRRAVGNIAMGLPANHGTEKEATDDGQNLADAVANIYEKLFKGAADGGLQASLRAEVLSDHQYRQMLMEEKTPEGRAQLLQGLVTKTLVEKFIDKGVVKGINSEGGESSDRNKINPKSNTQLGSARSLLNNITNESFKVGEDFNKEHVTVFQAPMTTGITDLKVPLEEDSTATQKQQGKIDGNDGLNEKADTRHVVTATGMKLEDYFESNEAYRNFVDSQLAIAPEANVPMVALPVDSDGNVVMHKYNEINYIKLEMRKRYLKFKREQGEPVNATAEELFPNNITKAKEYAEYKTFIDNGLRQGKHANNADELRAAKEILVESRSMISKAFGSKVAMIPHYGVKVLISNEADGFVEQYGDIAKSRNFGTKALKPVKNNDTYDKYVEDVMDLDTGITEGDHYQTMMFVRAKDMNEYGSMIGQKSPEIEENIKQYNQALEGLANQNIAGSVDNFELIASFLIE